MKSIQSRLTTGLFLSLITIFFIFWIIVSSNIQKLTEDYITSRLEHDIETILTAVNFDTKNKPTINIAQLNPVYNRPFSGHYYRIQHKKTILRSRSLWDQSLSVKKINSNTYIKTYQKGPQHQSLIVISRQFKKQEEVVNISVAEDLTPIKEDIKQFKNYFALIASIILFSLIFIQIIILRNELKPLRKIRNELYALEKGVISELNSNVPYELESVVKEVNHLTQSLQKRLKRSRDSLSDLSHAIKKPLTLLQNFSDTNQAEFNSESKIFLNQQIENIQNITDRILKRARVAGNSKINTAFNINEDFPLLIKTINAMYPDKKINLLLDIPNSLSTHIDREDMLELLGNLLDNAWKWAHNTIKIIIKETDDMSIIIEDDGPGANEDSLNELASRGVRLDESMEGYGFGLAIAADIVQDYQGVLMFSRSKSLGGFKLDIQFPLKV